MLILEDEWEKLYPGASIGMMTVSKVRNPKYHEALEKKKAELIESLQLTFKAKADLFAYESIQIYAAYYKHYKKTYHVVSQMESLIFKNRSIPCVATLVEAMFMAELNNGLLTAGHDVDTMKFPLKIGVSTGKESYQGISGKKQTTKQGDMIMYDREGVISSILCGPDDRTKIMENTTNCAFIVYMPAGIKQCAIEKHFDEIIENIRLFAPEVIVESRNIYKA